MTTQLPNVRRSRLAIVTAIVAAMVAVFVANSFASSAASDVLALSQRVDRHYNGLHTLQAQFVEKYRGNGTERTESGTLWIKRPGRMRWEYRQPRAKLFITDGKAAWFYAPGDRQARTTSSRKLDDLRSPLAYLLGKTRLERVFEGLSVVEGTSGDAQPRTQGNVVLQGKPRGLAGHLARVLLEVTPAGQIARIVAEGQDDSVTEYQLLESKEDVVIDDGRFHFVAPPGVEVIQGGMEQ